MSLKMQCRVNESVHCDWFCWIQALPSGSDLHASCRLGISAPAAPNSDTKQSECDGGQSVGVKRTDHQQQRRWALPWPFLGRRGWRDLVAVSDPADKRGWNINLECWMLKEAFHCCRCKRCWGGVFSFSCVESFDRQCQMKQLQDEDE